MKKDIRVEHWYTPCNNERVKYMFSGLLQWFKDLSFCCKQKYFDAGLLTITFRQDDITRLKWIMIWFVLETR